MDEGIGLQARREVLGVLRRRYAEATKNEKTRLLDEFVALRSAIGNTRSGCWHWLRPGRSSTWGLDHPAVGSMTRPFERR